jgi:hypothetical protein
VPSVSVAGHRAREFPGDHPQVAEDLAFEIDDQLLSRYFAPAPTATDRLRALPPPPPPPPPPASLAAAAAAAADAATTAAAAARARARLAVGALSVTAESAAEIEAGQ